MSCDCVNFPAIELDRQSINRRIKESPGLRKRLQIVAENKELSLHLFVCPECGQSWQSGHEWNFANQEYLFKVPLTSIEDWNELPYQQPAAMMIFSVSVQTFLDNVKPEPSQDLCRSKDCPEKAIKGSVLCTRHHVESLQNIGAFP